VGLPTSAAPSTVGPAVGCLAAMPRTSCAWEALRTTAYRNATKHCARMVCRLHAVDHRGVELCASPTPSMSPCAPPRRASAARLRGRHRRHTRSDRARPARRVERRADLPPRRHRRALTGVLVRAASAGRGGRAGRVCGIGGLSACWWSCRRRSRRAPRRTWRPRWWARPRRRRTRPAARLPLRG
jgi:hypothetical protein